MKTVVRHFDRLAGELVAKLPPRFHGGLAALSDIVSPISWAVVMLVGSLIAQEWGNTSLVVLSAFALLALPLAELIKMVVRRPRPISIYVENMRMRSYSFPSGHSYTASLGAIYLIVYLTQYISGPWLWSTSGIILAVTLAVALSRVYLKAHFPSDVVAGLLLGLIVAIALVCLVM